MASRLVHEVHSLIAFGLPYTNVHAKKDAFSQRVPGIRHREKRHRKYRRFGHAWGSERIHSEDAQRRTDRIARWKGDRLAEQHQAWDAHDIDDKSWDREDLSLPERKAVRLYWEGFCAWLVLSPEFLKSWAGVDVVEGRIHRVIDCDEIWEDEPQLRPAYAILFARVCFLLRRRKELCDMLVQYGGFERAALSAIACSRLRVLA